MTYLIRWMISRDFPEVMAIEANSFGSPWSENEFINCLRMHRVMAMVVEDGRDVLGYMVYDLVGDEPSLLNIAVHPFYRRQGLGRAMIERLQKRLGRRRPALRVAVRERNLDAQKFFRAMKFRAERVLRNQFDDTDEDAYLFRLRLNRREGVIA